MSQEALNVLRSIDATLKAMLALAQQRQVQARASQPKAVASDRDLDGKYGDPVVKFNPRDWNGASFKSRHFSECPPEFLDQLAQAFDWFAEQADQKGDVATNGKPASTYKRADAARARGWAKRVREGKHVPAMVGATAGAPSTGWAEEPEEAETGEGWD